MREFLATLLLVGAVVAFLAGMRDIGIALILSAFCMGALVLLTRK